MLKNKKIFLLLLIVIILLPLAVSADIDPKTGELIYNPSEEIPLVGKQSELTVYLRGIFQFGLAAIAIVSMLTMMVGGYLYIFSAGGDGVKKAKSTISNALLGLGLALASWIIVYTINPDLTYLRGIKTVGINVDLASLDNQTPPPPPEPRPIDDDPLPPGGGLNPESNSGVCEPREAGWNDKTVKMSSTVFMNFKLPLECVNMEGLKKLDLYVVVSDSTAGYGQDSQVYTLGSSLRKLDDNGQYQASWKAISTFPGGSMLVGNVKVTATVNKEGKDTFLSSPIKTFKNKIMVLSKDDTGECELGKTSVSWNSVGQVLTKTKVQAYLHVELPPGCLEKEGITDKFSLEVSISEKPPGKGDYFAKPIVVTAKTVSDWKPSILSDDTNYFILFTFEKNNPPAGAKYFAQVTPFRTKDVKTTTTTRRSLPMGEDLKVPE